MYAIETGLFPFAALVVGGVLYAVCRWVLRLRCNSRWVQAYIAVAVVLTTLTSFLTPVKVIEQAADTATAAEADMPLPAHTPPAYAEVHGSAPVTQADRAAAAQAIPFTPTVVPTAAGATPTPPRWHSLMADAWPVAGALYLVGLAAVLLWLVAQLLWLASLRRRYRCTDSADGMRIYHTDRPAPFSFFRSIFISDALTGNMRRFVLLHEQSHISHRHTLKLCLMQLFTALNWWNPFVWLLAAEMRLQQELEVDDDVLRQGIDREQYQLSLLQVCTQEGKWIVMRTAYNIKPLKQRLIFMNKQLTPQGIRHQKWLALSCLALTVAAAVTVACQTHQKPADADDAAADVRHHPMAGCWTMDWISNTGSGIENHPPAMHYGFYNDSTFLCFSYWAKRGVNIAFSMSGEGYTWQGDTLVDAEGHPTSYTFSNDGRTVVSRWMKDSLQNAYVSGPDISEQWSRIEPDRDIVSVFTAMHSLGQQQASKGINGAWREEGNDNSYLLISDTLLMVVNWYPSKIARGFRYGAGGFCGSIKQQADGSYLLFGRDTAHISQPDADHLSIDGDINGGGLPSPLIRTQLPSFLQRAFSPVVSVAAAEGQKQATE